MSFVEELEQETVTVDVFLNNLQKWGQTNYEINRSRCYRDGSLDPHGPFISWVVNQVREHGWSLDACVGRAKS